VGEAVLVVEGEDPGAVLLAAALRRHGWRIRLLDLRFHRPTLDGSDDPPVVVIDGTPTRPDLVVNRTGTSRLGLAPASALVRQIGTTWSARHLAAREEQGLLLACLDLWERSSRLYNPVRTLDHRLLRPAVEAELRAADVPLALGQRGDNGDGRPAAAWVVDGTIVASASASGAVAAPSGSGSRSRQTPTALADDTAAAVRRLADIVGLRLGQVDLWQPRDDGPAVVTDWKPVPGFRRIWEQTGVDVAALVVAALVGEEPAKAPGFLASDLEPNFLKVSTGKHR
jgi:hypothetical protein